MYAHLIIKEKYSSVHYIQEAENYLRKLEYYICASRKNKIGQVPVAPKAVFILTSEENSAYITDEQYDAIKKAEILSIPHFIIYKLKNCDELNIYTAESFRYSDREDKYGKLTKFIRTDFASYTMNNAPQISDTNSCKEMFSAKEEKISHTSMECDDDDEELLLILY